MSTVEKIIQSIETLSEEEFVQLKEWLLERDWERWDKEIERDSDGGKLNFLIQEARDQRVDRKLNDI